MEQLKRLAASMRPGQAAPDEGFCADRPDQRVAIASMRPGQAAPDEGLYTARFLLVPSVLLQ